jgi:hypothetical protein
MHGEEVTMETWQIVFILFLVLLPLALLADFHPARERLSARGRPLQRDWVRQIEHPPVEDEHH